MALLDLTTDEGDAGVRLELTGELDISSAPVLEEALGRIEAGQPALLEFLTSKEQDFSLHPVGSVSGVVSNT
jgi:hypothetical protein